jgi:hypothetical protein
MAQQRKQVFESKACRACHEDFIPIRKWQNFCSKQCRNRYWHSFQTMSRTAFSTYIKDHEHRLQAIEKRLDLPAILEKETK